MNEILVTQLIDQVSDLQKENAKLKEENMTLRFQRSDHKLLLRYLWQMTDKGFQNADGVPIITENPWLADPVANYNRSRRYLYK